MTSGMLLCGVSFVVAGILQLQLDVSVTVYLSTLLASCVLQATIPTPVPAGAAELGIFNTLPCQLDLTLIKSPLLQLELESQIVPLGSYGVSLQAY